MYDARAKAVRVSTLRLGDRSWRLYGNKAATFANGDVLGARVLASGKVEIYKNGTLVTTVTLSAADQAFFNAKGGKIGIWTAAASSAACLRQGSDQPSLASLALSPFPLPGKGRGKGDMQPSKSPGAVLREFRTKVDERGNATR